MKTRSDILMLSALSQMLQYVGNDPRVYALYFTCKTFYELFLRRKDAIYAGFDKYCNYGWNWTVAVKDYQFKGHLQKFYHANFKGYVVCDFEPLYAYCYLKNFGYLRIPSNITRFFYILKYGGLKNLEDRSLYILKKKNMRAKSNIVSLNESNVIVDPESCEVKMNLVVDENYVVHEDSFIVGIKICTMGVVLTLKFCMGKMNYFGITCYCSFKMWIQNVRYQNMRYLKCCFSYYPFLRKILAMYQCKHCNKILKRFFEHFFRTKRPDHSIFDNFSNFQYVMKYNSKRRPKFVCMNRSFTSKYAYSDASKLPVFFDHLQNGELIHDCYYDLLESDRKVLFIEDFNFIKYDEYGCPKLTCTSLLTEHCDFNIDERLKNIKLNCENRDFLAESVKRTFAYFVIF